jgi:hypothetical protein
MGMPVTASQIRAAPVESPRDDHVSVLGPLDRQPVSGLQVEGRLVRAIHVERRRVVLVRDPPLAAYLAHVSSSSAGGTCVAGQLKCWVVISSTDVDPVSVTVTVSFRFLQGSLLQQRSATVTVPGRCPAAC